MMNFKFALIFGLALFSNWVCASYQRMPLNVKLPSQEVLEHYTVTPQLASNPYVNDYAGSTASLPVTLTTFASQPDTARNLVVTPGGTTGDVEAGNVTIAGWDAQGKAISEDFAFLADASTPVTGNKAFSKITSITFPAESNSNGATWDITPGNKLGLPKCLDGSGFYIKGMVDKAALTGETLAVNASTLSGNTVIPNPLPDGTRVFDFLYVQNFRCD